MPAGDDWDAVVGKCVDDGVVARATEEIRQALVLAGLGKYVRTVHGITESEGLIGQ